MQAQKGGARTEDETSEGPRRSQEVSFLGNGNSYVCKGGAGSNRKTRGPEIRMTQKHCSCQCHVSGSGGPWVRRSCSMPSLVSSRSPSMAMASGTLVFQKSSVSGRLRQGSPQRVSPRRALYGKTSAGRGIVRDPRVGGWGEAALRGCDQAESSTPREERTEGGNSREHQQYPAPAPSYS